MTPAQAKADRKRLMRDIAKDERRRAREQLLELRSALREARSARKVALSAARESCRASKLAARSQAREIRARLLEEIRATVRAVRREASESCAAGLTSARAIKDRIGRARAELEAERKFRREMRRIEGYQRERTRELAGKRPRGALAAAERRGESDDEVEGNLEPELVSLWRRVKARIKGGPRRTRTEAFLEYAQEHPGEVLEAAEDSTDRLVRELEQREREMTRALRKGGSSGARSRARAPASSDDVPF